MAQNNRTRSAVWYGMLDGGDWGEGVSKEIGGSVRLPI